MIFACFLLPGRGMRGGKILGNLEESELTPEGNVRAPRRQHDRDKLKTLAPTPQMDLFG